MRKVRSKLFIRSLKATLYVLVACAILIATAYAPEKESEVPQTISETDPPPISSIQFQVPPTSVPIPTPIEENTADAETEPETENNPYADLLLTDDEKELLACMAFSEARNQSFDGQVAVVQVALNRYMHEAYFGSISDILLAPYQFAVGDYYEREQMEAVEAALAGYPALDLDTDVVYFSTGALTYGSYYKTIGDHVFRTYS